MSPRPLKTCHTCTGDTSGAYGLLMANIVFVVSIYVKINLTYSPNHYTISRIYTWYTGGHISDTWTSDCSYLVMSEIEVTTKLLLALIDQKDVVTPDYFDSWLIPNVLVGVMCMSMPLLNTHIHSLPHSWLLPNVVQGYVHVLLFPWMWKMQELISIVSFHAYKCSAWYCLRIGDIQISFSWIWPCA